MSMDIATDYQNQILHCPLNNEVNNISNFHWQEKIHCNSQVDRQSLFLQI